MISMSDCLSVCLSVRSHISKTTRRHFVKFYVHVDCESVTVACSSSGRIAICDMLCISTWCVLLHVMRIPKPRQHNSLNYCIESNHFFIFPNNKDRLLRCWLGGRKGIWPVKTDWWGVVWLSVWDEVHIYGPADATATHCLLLQ